MDIIEGFDDNAASKFAGNSTSTYMSSWKQMYISHVKNMKRLMSEEAIVKKHLYGHTARVFALYYNGNYLATGEICIKLSIRAELLEAW